MKKAIRGSSERVAIRCVATRCNLGELRWRSSTPRSSAAAPQACPRARPSRSRGALAPRSRAGVPPVPRPTPPQSPRAPRPPLAWPARPRSPRRSPAVRRTQRHSGALSGAQAPSAAVRRNQAHSGGAIGRQFGTMNSKGPALASCMLVRSLRASSSSACERSRSCCTTAAFSLCIWALLRNDSRRS